MISKSYLDQLAFLAQQLERQGQFMCASKIDKALFYFSRTKDSPVVDCSISELLSSYVSWTKLAFAQTTDANRDLFRAKLNNDITRDLTSIDALLSSLLDSVETDDNLVQVHSIISVLSILLKDICTAYVQQK